VINGIVIGRQPQVKVIVRISGYPDLEVGCVINTGFEGALSLPVAAVAKLQLPYVASINTNLANDENTVTPVHRATVVWDGVELEVPVLAMGRRPQVGTLLLNNCNLNIDFSDGSILSIDASL
jgi:clan AA aspartic protease